MKRPVRVCIGLIAVVILSAILVIERGTGWAAPKPPVPEFKLKNDPARPPKHTEATAIDGPMP
jgi:hypothetical protein